MHNCECHGRDAFREGLGSVVANGHTFDECKEILKKCTSIDDSARLRAGSLIATASNNTGREFQRVLLLV